MNPWVFPATDARVPVGVQSIGKQLADRQRDPEKRLENRTKATTSLAVPGGRWTPLPCPNPTERDYFDPENTTPSFLAPFSVNAISAREASS